jgi:hypothetical protein
MFADAVQSWEVSSVICLLACCLRRGGAAAVASVGKVWFFFAGLQGCKVVLEVVRRTGLRADPCVLACLLACPTRAERSNGSFFFARARARRGCAVAQTRSDGLTGWDERNRWAGRAGLGGGRVVCRLGTGNGAGRPPVYPDFPIQTAARIRGAVIGAFEGG